ncbi:uncharacterized protein [Magallana gigas]|uniref:uncharacterized protein n=1 Tax=Magallana gigas TaxID=29159 RepID=UPI003340E73E
MAASDKVFVAALLLMSMLSISHRGVSAQTVCSSALGICAAGVTGDNETFCRRALTCIDTSLVCGREEKDEAKKKLIEKGCSGSGIPIISAMSLFVAALFHML